MDRRTFRHDVEQRSWWVETDGALLRTASSSDDDPEWLQRERRLTNADAATAEAARMIAEQLADGFSEVGDPPPAPETARGLFERLARAWRDQDPSAPVSGWLAATLARGGVLLGRLSDELSALDGPAHHGADTWLCMQRPIVVDPLLLALRDPRHAVRTGALYALRDLRERHDELEGAILSLIEHAPPAPYSGAAHTAAQNVTVARHPFSEAGITRAIALTSHPDPGVATNAAFVLGRFPALGERRVLEALRAWNARREVGDLPLAVDTREHVEAELRASARAPGRSGTDASPAAIDARIEVAIRAASR